jgi:transcriptional regulator GlxA family with amidase domain
VLTETEPPVAEIAAATGFSSEAHMTTTFQN